MFCTRSRNWNTPWHHLVYQISDMWSACHYIVLSLKETVCGLITRDSKSTCGLFCSWIMSSSVHERELVAYVAVMSRLAERYRHIWDMKEVLNIHTPGLLWRRTTKGWQTSKGGTSPTSYYDYPVQKWQSYSGFGQTLKIISDVNEQELWGSTFVFGGSWWVKYTRWIFPLLLPD